jgi:transcription termination factor Rho
MTKAELESKHIAELQALAAEAEVPRYRALRREQLVEALLAGDQGEAEDGGPETAPESPDAEEKPEPGKRRRRRRGGRGRSARAAPEESGDDGEERESGSREAKAADEVEGSKENGGKPPGDEGEAVTGIVDVVAQGHGFLRLGGLDPRAGDVYISASQIRRCELRAGDEVSGPAREPRRGERHRALTRVDIVNGAEPSEERSTAFEDLTPVAPHRRIALEIEPADVLVRAADLLAPLAYGQRVLVRARPRSGRTTLLRGLAKAIAGGANAPGIVVLLVDERPEEITEWKRQATTAEIAAAAADLEPADQVRHAELAVARAKRRAEAGEDVVLIIDSLTRLGVAQGDPAAVKPVFGAGRELEEEGAGSLTVVATVLGGTEDGDGSLEATETTENAMLTLDADLASSGVVPAFDPSASAVSGEESLREESELAAARALREELRGRPPVEAAALLRERIEATSSNAELLSS